MNVNIGEFMRKRALLTPDREGLVCEDVRRSYGELNERANRFADAMLRLGVGHGDRVAVLALNEPEYFDMLFGLGKIGATLVPINYRLAGPEIEFIASDSGARVFVFGADFTDTVDSIRSQIPAKEFVAISDEAPEWATSYESMIGGSSAEEPVIRGGDDDTLTILYTSGTTGRPKGAELSHAYYFWSSVNLMATLGTQIGDTPLVALPLFHIGGLAGPPWFVYQGAKTVLLRSLDPKRFLELLGEEEITGFGSVPALLDFLKLVPDFEKYHWDSVKVILVYAAPVPVTLIKEYEEAGIEVRQLYGLTECNTGSVLSAEDALSKVGSCGKPFFHVRVRVVDDDGRDVGPEERGEVLLHAPNTMKGYWNRPEDTAAALKDGWLPLYHGPEEGHDHLRRGEHLPRRDRRLSPAPSEGRRRGSHRLPGREVGRSRQRDRSREGRGEAHGGGADRVVSGQDREIQDPQEGGPHRLHPQNADRQDPETRIAGAIQLATMEKVNVGIIGTGLISSLHACTPPPTKATRERASTRSVIWMRNSSRLARMSGG